MSSELTALYYFEKFFEVVKKADRHREEYNVYEYNGQRVFSITRFGKRFIVAFDIENGFMVWEDIESYD